MPRTVNEVAHARRRNEFIDSAQQLLATKGYERMTIQDVLDKLGTSKGALYHYFDSKQALLEGIVERATDVAEKYLSRCMADTDLSALEKLREFFSAMAQWKVERRELLLDMLPLWISEDNVVFRQKMRSTVTARLAPLLTCVVDQGVREGVFTARYSDHVSRVVMGLLSDLNEAVVRLLAASQSGNGDYLAVERTVAAYTDALERVLGAPSGSLVLADASTLRPWFDDVALPRGDDRESEENRHDQVH